MAIVLRVEVWGFQVIPCCGWEGLYYQQETEALFYRRLLTTRSALGSRVSGTHLTLHHIQGFQQTQFGFLNRFHFPYINLPQSTYLGLESFSRL